MPTFAYVGTPVCPGSAATKQGAQEGKGVYAVAKMVECTPNTALLPRIGCGPLKDMSV